MPKQGEIDYVSKLAPTEIAHILNKPFSDAKCGQYLMDVGLILSLIPPPPGRLLDLGVGPGWTSLLFAQRGYDVVGVDLAPAMIELARENQVRAGVTNLQFQAGDYETLADPRSFDIAVFYDALHHAEDEERALAAVWLALKAGGVCVTAEPGAEHGDDAGARAAVARFGVTEKSMPPRRIIEVGRRAGFTSFAVYERPTSRLLAREPDRWRWKALRRAIGAIVKDPWRAFVARRQALAGSHLVVLRK
ncbi:MAG: class I SAM-dependent methyltransferase [Gemmataceae bacterium]|nr:class I SAM-dependent methyltransferase [Gemmataceae bacterium]